MPRIRKDEIVRLYQNHPLREESILARVFGEKLDSSPIAELDLAKDTATEMTDQNHVGGLPFVLQLARRAKISRDSYVLDLGCGLGGSARCLADRIGCRVHGIDLSQTRCEMMRKLTSLVGLQQLVSVEQGDFMTMELPANAFDVVWGQSAWVHVPNKSRLIKRCSKVLKPLGRLAFEDSYVKCVPRDAAERRSLSRLERCWKSDIVALPHWCSILRREAFRLEVKEDLTRGFIRYFSRLARIAANDESGTVPADEIAGWKYATTLGASGVLGYFRIVAHRTT